MEKTHIINSLTFQMENVAKIFHNITEAYFNQEVKNNITLEEYAVMDTIVCYPNIDRNRLAKTLLKEKDYIDKQLSKLLKKNFIKEVKNSDSTTKDTHYELTKNGNRVYQDIVLGKDHMVCILAKFISESELITFTKTLLKIRNILISLSDVDYQM